MSDSSEDTIQSDRQLAKEDNICRDYARGICDRKFCKYKHETDPKSLNFCHDYQNSMCPRPHCRFIHCTLDEVDEYKRTGQMSTQILAEATRKNQLPGIPPVCKQFKKGICRRNLCKYRHITKEQEETEILSMVQNKQTAVINDNPSEMQFNNLGAFSATNGVRRNKVDFEEYNDNGIPCPKRRFLPPQEQDISQYEVNPSKQTFKGYYTGSPPSPILNRVDARTFMLEEENSILHKEIAQLKKKVSDLTATNEFLLDQNAQLRIGGKRPGNVGGPGGQDPGNAAQAVAQAAAQQQATGTVIASVATVPVSLATVSTCNPVSGNHSVSIAGCPTVSIAPAAAAQILAQPSQQILVTTNPTSQLAIAAAANSSQQAQLAIARQNLANNLQAQPQLTSQAQLTLAAATTQQLTSQAQQLALANTPQQLTVANVPQQLVLAASTNQQLIATQTIATDMHRAAANGQTQGINTSQAMAASQAQPLMSYPIITQQSISHTLTH